MSTITFDIDEEVRDSAEAVLSSLNLTLDEAVSMFLNAVVRKNGLPQGLKREQLILRESGRPTMKTISVPSSRVWRKPAPGSRREGASDASDRMGYHIEFHSN